jgi:hypothetical protein
MSISGWLMGHMRIRSAMVAAGGRLGQVGLWTARQEDALAGIPSSAGVLRLQPTRLRVRLCRPSPVVNKGGSIPPATTRLVPQEGAMQEILFVVEEAEDGSHRASAAGAADVTPFIGPGLMRVGGCGHAAASC